MVSVLTMPARPAPAGGHRRRCDTGGCDQNCTATTTFEVCRVQIVWPDDTMSSISTESASTASGRADDAHVVVAGRSWNHLVGHAGQAAISVPTARSRCQGPQHSEGRSQRSRGPAGVADT